MLVTSDIHISHLHTKNNNYFKKLVDFADEFTPDTFFIEGDLVDNWIKIPLAKIARQSDDFKIYRGLTENIVKKVPNFIDIIGNHDMFGVSSFHSKKKNIARTSNYYSKTPNITLDEFRVATEVIDNITHIIINPIIFPFNSASFMDTFVHPNTAFMDQVEREIEFASKNSPYPIILNTHYPTNFWENVKSSKGNNIKQILQKSNVSIMLTGHSHPKSYVLMHRNGCLEAVLSDLKSRGNFYVVTNDNNQLSITELNVMQEQKMVITNPVPMNTLNHKSIFNENETPLRVLAFSNNTLNLTAKVNSKIYSLEFQRYIKDGIGLYETMISLANGKNSIKVKGFGKQSITVFCGKQVKYLSEYQDGFLRELYTGNAAFYIISIFCLILTFPLNIQSHYPAFIQNIDSSIYGKMNIKGFLIYVVMAPIHVKYRLSLLPFFYRLILFTLTFSPFIFPLYFTSFDNELYFTYFYGWGSTVSLHRDVTGTIVCAVFYLIVVIPNLLISYTLSIIKDISKPSLYVSAISFVIIQLISLAFCWIIVQHFLTQNGGWVTALTSPLFFISPLFMTISNIIAFRDSTKRKTLFNVDNDTSKEDLSA